MSVLGTSVAAGLAQTGLQAQQIARQQDKKTRDKKRAAQRTREVQEVQIKGLEEDDAAEDSTRLHLGSDVPRQQRQSDQTGKQNPPAPRLDVQG